MEADIAQIKTLLWVIIGLMAVFVSLNVLCNIVGCGKRNKDDFIDLLDRGQIDDLIRKTRARLKTHPRDVNALYFNIEALIASDRMDEARVVIKRLSEADPTMSKTCREWLDAIDGNTDKPAN